MENNIGKRVVFLSAFQDFRTKKRASIQQVAEGARDLGYDVWFVSARYSLLSKLKGDSRLSLDNIANEVQVIDGIHCLLWKTLFHPFASANKFANLLMSFMYRPYAAWPSRAFDKIIEGADYVVVESSVAVVFLSRIKRLSPNAKIIYYATDLLDTVGAHTSVQQSLLDNNGTISHVCVRSSKMVKDFGWAIGRLYRASFGVRSSDFADVGDSPYGDRRAVVSVGSMLFDRRYFETVPRSFSDIDFHVIGCGETFDAPPNVYIHSEMPFRETLPYIKYAAAGVAPYRQAPGVEYLAESSLKLAQYEVCAIPAICPSFAVGDSASRFGYDVASDVSMIAATRLALASTGLKSRSFPSWEDVAAQVLHPELFPELKLASVAG